MQSEKAKFSQGESTGDSLKQTFSHQSALFCQIDCKYMHTKAKHTQTDTHTQTKTHTNTRACGKSFPLGACIINTPMNKFQVVLSLGGFFFLKGHISRSESSYPYYNHLTYYAVSFRTPWLDVCNLHAAGENTIRIYLCTRSKETQENTSKHHTA